MMALLKRHSLTFFGILIVLILSGVSLWYVRNHAEPPPPVLGSLPDFTLTHADGKPFSKKQLDGRAQLVNFIFTSCPDVCPLLTRQMKKIQAEVHSRGLPVSFVSISVDPETDTPEVMSRYIRQHEVETKDWVWLTGDSASVQKVIVEGFKVGLSQKDPNTDIYDVTHSEHFVVIDAMGRIRAYERIANSQDIEKVLRILAIL
jgi:protein SCO1/2